MGDSRFVDLTQTAPSSANVQFISAEVPASRSPFIRVFYEWKGQREKYALRLDLDKRVFLDHLENAHDDTFIQNAAPEIAEILSDEITF